MWKIPFPDFRHVRLRYLCNIARGNVRAAVLHHSSRKTSWICIRFPRVRFGIYTSVSRKRSELILHVHSVI
jgi:hypothetical protein